MDNSLLTTLLDKAKLTLRITTNAFDEEIADILQAGYMDLKTRGILVDDKSDDPLVTRAILTYCRLQFGEPENAERLRRSYMEQKGQLMCTTGYTTWGEV